VDWARATGPPGGQCVDRTHWGLLPFDEIDFIKTMRNGNSFAGRIRLSGGPEKQVGRA
jgi:hypothetical protein